MARLELTKVIPDEDGLNPDPMTAGNADGFYFKPGNLNWELELLNGDASAKQVTLPTSYVSGINTLSDNVISIPAGERRIVRIPAALQGNYLQTNPDTGQLRSVIFINFDAVTNVTCQLREIA